MSKFSELKRIMGELNPSLILRVNKNSLKLSDGITGRYYTFLKSEVEKSITVNGNEETAIFLYALYCGMHRDFDPAFIATFNYPIVVDESFRPVHALSGDFIDPYCVCIFNPLIQMHDKGLHRGPGFIKTTDENYKNQDFEDVYEAALGNLEDLLHSSPKLMFSRIENTVDDIQYTVLTSLVKHNVFRNFLPCMIPIAVSEGLDSGLMRTLCEYTSSDYFYIIPASLNQGLLLSPDDYESVLNGEGKGTILSKLLQDKFDYFSLHDSSIDFKENSLLGATPFIVYSNDEGNALRCLPVNKV